MPYGQEIINCRPCRGTGARDRDGREPLCQVCGGKGVIRVRAPYRNCNICRGTGTRDRDGRPPFCKVCDGSGVFPDAEIVSRGR